MISLPKIPYIHRIYMVLANPENNAGSIIAPHIHRLKPFGAPRRLHQERRPKAAYSIQNN